MKIYFINMVFLALRTVSSIVSKVLWHKKNIVIYLGVANNSWIQVFVIVNIVDSTLSRLSMLCSVIDCQCCVFVVVFVVLNPVLALL